jgi:hypothetical protein
MVHLYSHFRWLCCNGFVYICKRRYFFRRLSGFKISEDHHRVNDNSVLCKYFDIFAATEIFCQTKITQTSFKNEEFSLKNCFNLGPRNGFFFHFIWIHLVCLCHSHYYRTKKLDNRRGE